MKKRIGSLLMALVLALSLVPATVWAADGATEVGTFEALKAAVDAENSTIILTADIDLTEPLLIDSKTADITIRSKEGETYTLKRPAETTLYQIDLTKGGKLTLENVTLEGNGEVVKPGYPFILVEDTTCELHLKSGTTIRNCVTKNYATYNGGAICSAGSVYMYEGSAITNCSSQTGGAINLSYTSGSSSTIKKFANFTMYGGTISGCSATGLSNTAHGGGALYAYGNVNVNLNGGVIEKNTSAANGGGVFVQPFKYNSNVNTATVNLAGTTIRDNTATKRGGGVYFNGDTQDVITASGVTTITGNSGMNGTDNVYLAVGRTLVDKGLESGSAIGISCSDIPSLLVSGTNVNSDCFTADRVDAKLTPTEKGLQIEAKEVHEHCICGRTDCKETGNGHGRITCTGVSSPELITTKGEYFLMNDAELSYNKSGNSWTAPAGVTLCLNGHTLRRGSNTAAAAIVVTGGNTFNLTDCQNNAGKVTSSYFSSEYNRDEARWGTGVSVAKNATFNMYGGTISGNTAYDSTNIAAGGVVVNGTFNMYGGELVNNYRSTKSETLGSAVMVNSTGTFNMMGGLIARNASQDSEYGNTSTIARNGGAVYVKGGTFNMSGGEISRNTAGAYYAPSDGGAVYVANDGAFKMSGGVITGNTASRNGGGVAVAEGTFTMSGDARVTGNNAFRESNSNFKTFNGGGVYVGASGVFTMNDSASVDTNETKCCNAEILSRGGGVYVENGGVFTMNDQAAVKDNKASVRYSSSFSDTVFGGGIYVNGTLNLNGGTVTGNTAYLRGGGIYVDTKGTANLGTGTVTVKGNTIHNGDFTDNVYLVGNTKLVAENAPAKNTSIGISVPLSRATAGSVVITNAEGSIETDDKRFPLDISEIKLERSGDDLKVTLPVHKHGAVTYTPVERLSDIKGEGNYYLVQDSTMTGSLTIAADTTVNICLNGHKNASTNIENNGTLTITDCKHKDANPGYLTATTGYRSATPIANKTGAKLTLDSVIVRDITGGYDAIKAEGDSTVILKNSIFSDNAGTALYVNGATATVTNCTFEKNGGRAIYADYHGQYKSASITVTDSTFTGNSTTSNDRGGGAVYCTYRGGTTITGCTFTGNSTPKTSGGALWLQGMNMRISDCTITGNSAGWKGGGIYLPYGSGYEAPVFSGTVIVKDNTVDGVENNVHLNGYLRWSVFVYADSNFSTSSRVGISADNIPTLAVKGTTDTRGFFADNKDSYTLRSTTDSTGPHLASANSDENHTGLELWHNGKGHTHFVCGTGKNTADSNHTTHKNVKWIGVTTLYDLPEGNYYLLKSVANYPYGASWSPVGNSNLCLNGFTYTARPDDSYAPNVVVGKGVNASITDCSEEGTGKLIAGSDHQGVSVASSGTFTLWRGSISKCEANTSDSGSTAYRNGGGVHVLGTFIMNGGSITNCTAYAGHGGGVYVSGGTFIMNDGTITGNSTKTKSPNTTSMGYGGGVYGSNSTITINGGTITGNKATNGGAIYAKGGTLTIGKANITDNTASHGGGGIYAYECALTIDGATVTGNNGGDSLGGGIYISEAKGNGTASDPYIPAVIKNATIENNTAKCGGGISTSGPVKISDTTITGNTATKLKNWGGGGVNARIIPKSSKGNGWVFELSGKMNITGNYAEGVVNNLYFHEVDAGTMLPAVTGLTAGSTIGVTTAMDSLQADNTIVPVYITSDKGETGYFTSDKGYIVRLDATQNQLYVIAESYSVSVTLGENMESTGTLTQDLLKGAAMTDVVITAKDGYYFPENYGFTQDGITVRRDGPTQITVTGTPTADASLVLLSATAKATPAAPTGLTGVAPTDWDAADGKISGTKSTMEWSADGKTWTDCTDTPTTVGISGTYYVRIKATDISYASAAAEVIVPKYLKSVVFPRPAMTIFFYDGTEHTLFVPSEDYTVSGVIKATDAGAYKATVTLDQDKYQWSVAPESDTITWLIGRKTARAQDFTFTAPDNLIWDGTAKTAAITVNTSYTLGGCNTSLVYKQGGNVVASPTDPGTYQVYLVITGEGNFTPTGPDGFTADAWTFTIQHPAQHIWGDWQHNDTQHYRTCTVPGCTDEERADHETNTPATCTAKAVCAVCGNQYGKMDTHNHPADKVSTTAYLAPTCGSKGHETYKHCAGCGKYFQDGDANLYSNVGRFDIAPLSHKNAVKTDAVAATCTAGGNQAYWHCDDCGSYFADKDGKLDASTAYDSNDTFQLSALGHDYQGQPYQSDSTGHWQICKRSGCGTESTHEDHSGPAATCAAASRCATCGYQLAGIDPNNHVSPAKHEAAAPTCTVKGNSEYYSCAACGKFFSGKDGDTALYDDASTFDIAPLHHKNAVKTDAVAPTCEVGGNQAYWHCGDCGSYFADKDGKLDASTAYNSNDTFQLSALGHDYQGQPYQSDSTGHWQICKRSGCGTESTHEDHSGPAATCVSASKCATCGYQLADIDPNHHVNAAKHEAAAATCTADGNEAYYACADCHKFFAVTADGQLDPSAVHDSAADFTLAKLDHSSATAYPAAAPDCENAGSSLYFRCDYCGKFFGANADGSINKADQHDSAEDFVLAPLAHKNAVKTDAVAAACTAGGSEAYYTCPDCGGFFGVNADGSLNSADRRAAAQDFATAPTGHDLTKTEAQAPACTETGNSEYYTCAACGKFFSDAEGTNEIAKDSWVIAPTGHDLTKTDAQAPTCTESGNSEYFTCAACGKFFSDAEGANEIAKDSWVIAPTGHDLTKTDAQAPTCTESGNSEYFTCATCGKFFSDAEGASEIAQDSWVIAPTGHDLTKAEAQAPTCTESGNSEYYTCTACGKFFSDAEGTNEIAKDSWVIAPTGHDLTKTDAQAPTCTESGNSAYYTCATCGKFFSDAEGANEITKDSWAIASLGHDFTQQLSDDAHLRTPASCTDAAEYFYSCSRCGAHSADKFFSSGDALGHDYMQVIDPSHLSTAATCTEDAVYYVSCSRCQANGTETFAATGTALGHSFTHYIYNNDATYDADGTETAVCDRTGCDATDTRSKTGTKLVDSAAPVVSGVENGGVYCLTVDITVSDPHLDTVTLNGQAVTLTDGKLTVSGQAGTQTLVATDRFGNRTAVTFTVNPDHTPDAGKVVRQPTAATEGEKVFTCTVCGAALGTEPVAKLAPTVLEGTGSQYSSGSGKTLRFRYDASREDLLQVFVDGVMLRSTQYIVSGDSAVVTLTDSFLQTLSSGTHKLEAVFTTGTASADFTVIASDDHPDVPTGDSGRPILWASLSGVCGLALLALPEIKKRRSHR